MKPRNVSLCSGYGGLDLAVEAVFDADTVAHCEWEEAPSKVLAARWPGVPNLHDVKTADWGSVQAEILSAGYPCQPFSAAGRRKGTDDPRHLWPHVAEAIRRVRPRLVVLENVAGHRSLGFGDVLGDLAAMRYVGSWVSLRASDVGACHGRERVFILARDADRLAWSPTGAFSGRPVPMDGPGPVERALGSDRLPDAADTTCSRRAGINAGIGGGAARSGRERVTGRGARRPSAADPDSFPVRLEPVAEPGSGSPAESGHTVRWGKYGAGVRRHERILGRVAPNPSEPAPKGGRRLSPRFVEWMQMLPEGWVTDVPGLTRDEQLTALGNGVVPPQAIEAQRRLLAIEAERAA